MTKKMTEQEGAYDLGHLGGGPEAGGKFVCIHMVICRRVVVV